jgi:hypothetical protein
LAQSPNGQRIRLPARRVSVSPSQDPDALSIDAAGDNCHLLVLTVQSGLGRSGWPLVANTGIGCAPSRLPTARQRHHDMTVASRTEPRHCCRPARAPWSRRVMAAGTPCHLSSGGSGWLVPVEGSSGPGLRFRALANRSAPAFRCQRLASRASRSSSSQCQDPSRIRRRIRTGPCTAQTAVRLAASSCSRTCVVLAILESSPHPGVGGSSRSRPSERWSSACWRACRLV